MMCLQESRYPPCFYLLYHLHSMAMLYINQTAGPSRPVLSTSQFAHKSELLQKSFFFSVSPQKMATSNNSQLWYFTTSGGSLMILFSSVILSMAYHRLAPLYPTVRKSAWILTTISSTVMTLSSLPFLYDYFSHGGSVKYVRDIPRFSVAVNRFFQSYLVR